MCSHVTGNQNGSKMAAANTCLCRALATCLIIIITTIKNAKMEPIWTGTIEHKSATAMINSGQRWLNNDINDL